MSLNLGRDDRLDRLQLRSIPEEEPVFQARAQDINGAAVAVHWVRLYLESGGAVARAEQALRHAERMAAWPLKKLPDADDIAPDERDALEVAFHARNFDFDRAAASKGLQLAETRGYGRGFDAAQRAGAQAFDRLRAENDELRREVRRLEDVCARRHAEIRRLTDPVLTVPAEAPADA